MASEKCTITFDRVITETNAAILIKKDGREYWFPFATVHAVHNREHRGGEKPTIVVDYWKAKQLGLT